MQDCFAFKDTGYITMVEIAFSDAAHVAYLGFIRM
jgi:hypothetical protein